MDEVIATKKDKHMAQTLLLRWFSVVLHVFAASAASSQCKSTQDSSVSYVTAVAKISI